MSEIEIGSFLELDIRTSGEYYSNHEIARLNTARAGIFHAMKLLETDTLYLPYYMCPSVKSFLSKKGIKMHFYNLGSDLLPMNLEPQSGSAVLICNYFGIIQTDKLASINQQYKNVIIDNSQAFFNQPIDGCYNVYSTRKFFGVPDGCYVIGNNAEQGTEDYSTDQSSETSNFLFKRIEAGCNSAYPDRMKNEERLDTADVLNMSGLTKALLQGIDYETIKAKRKSNFFGIPHTICCLL